MSPHAIQKYEIDATLQVKQTGGRVLSSYPGEPWAFMVSVDASERPVGVYPDGKLDLNDVYDKSVRMEADLGDSQTSCTTEIPFVTSYHKLDLLVSILVCRKSQLAARLSFAMY